MAAIQPSCCSCIGVHDYAIRRLAVASPAPQQAAAMAAKSPDVYCLGRRLRSVNDALKGTSSLENARAREFICLVIEMSQTRSRD
jgi:hypothetical protein